MNTENILNNIIYPASKITSSLSYIPKQSSTHYFSQAIQNYKDECMTGLTEEERKKIQQEIKAYLDAVPEGQKVDFAKLKDFIAKLLHEYGFKGDIDDLCMSLIGDATADLSSQATSSEDAKVAYEKLKSAKSTEYTESTPHFDSQDKTSNKSEEQTVRQIITNPDGSKSLVTLKNKVIISTIRLDSGFDELNYNLSDSLSSKFINEGDSYEATT